MPHEPFKGGEIGMSMTGIETEPTLTLGASAMVLVSWWKPLILLLTMSGWLWIISYVYDKHAARFFLPRQQWNAVHMTFGFVALAAALLIPMKSEGAFWIGWLVMVVLLTADLIAYAQVANRDERVPERFHIRLDTSMIREMRAKKADAKLEAQVELMIKKPDGALIPSPQKETPEFEVRTAAERVFIAALEARASQLDIAPASADGAYQVSWLVDGVRQNGETFTPQGAAAVMDFWKTAAGLDVSDRRRRLVGKSSVKRGESAVPVRVVSIGVKGGMRVTITFHPEAQVKRKVEDLGLLDMQLEELRAMATDAQGVVLVATPVKGGQTTLFYSLSRLHDAYTQNVQTLEMDPQASLEGIRTTVFDPQGGAEYGTTLRSILRRDPDVVFVADLPDEATVKEIVKADHERTRLYVAMRANSAIEAVQSFLRMAQDPEGVGKALRGVVAGKLVRKLCTNCRQAYVPAPEMLKKLGVPEGKVQRLFKAGGQVLIKNKPEVCPMCRGVGYHGQEGVYEVFRFTAEDQALIGRNDLQGLMAQLRKKQQPSIQQSCIRKSIGGTTSVEEMLRVTQPPSQGSAGAGSGGSSPKAPTSSPPASPPVPAAS